MNDCTFKFNLNIPSILLVILSAGFALPASAQGDRSGNVASPSLSAAAPLDVEWYQPETERSRYTDRAKVILSGQTRPGAWVRIDGSSVTVLKPKNPQAKGGEKIENRETRANAEGYFETALDLPEGLVQVPIFVSTSKKNEKTFLVSVDVSLTNIKMANNKVSENKPPAAAKKIRLWGGLGMTYQTYKQSTEGASDLSFQNMQAPGILARGGYWGDRWGLDLYFRDAPGKIEAEAPYQLQSNTYHWRTLEAKGLYQFARSSTSRMWGLPSQWQLRFGAQMHQIPFLEIDNTNSVTIRDHSLTTATLGIGLLLGQERDWSYEFALGWQVPVSAKGSSGTQFKVSSPVAFEAQIGAAYKFAPNWRLGLFSYIQSHSYSYQFENAAGQSSTGKQNLFYSTFDLRLGYEY